MSRTLSQQRDAILAGLSCGAPACSCGSGAQTHCPLHPDPEASLSIVIEAGILDLHCGIGCEPHLIHGDLQTRGLWVKDEDDGEASVDVVAAALGLRPAFLRSLDVRDGVWGVHRGGCVDISYHDEAGQLTAVRKQLHVGRDARSVWRRGDKPSLYGLPRLSSARVDGRLLIVCREEEAWLCWHADLRAVAIPLGARWRPEWDKLLEGIEQITLWPDPAVDQQHFLDHLRLLNPDIRLVQEVDSVGTLTDVWTETNRDVALFRTWVEKAVSDAQTLGAIQEAEDRREATEAFAAARSLLERHDLLDYIASAMANCGYAGDVTPALLAYLALTSRLLPRPMNLAFVAPSAAGKNRAVDAARALVPESCYHLVRAASPRALIYSDEDYQHRVIIMTEADSLPEDGSAGSAIRSLMSDGELAYEVVESMGGMHYVRTIRKPGPTGLLTTSTRPLPHQMDTRVLTVSIVDTPEQTRMVLRAEAALTNGGDASPDLGPLLALQRWLELGGIRDVHVPFAAGLADTVPVQQVRMRRDFPQLLTAIQAVALLHQVQREKDAEGRVVATLDDYQIVRTLLLPTFTEAATAGVSEAVRETVEAVAALMTTGSGGDSVNNAVSKADVARHLGLPKDTVWRRVERCIELGYLVNLTSRRSLPARLVLGEPLPDAIPALPDPETLRASPIPVD